MRLIYTATQEPVAIGDRHTVGGFALQVTDTPPPHKPNSEGKVYLSTLDGRGGPCYYVGVIGAKWIEREDRADWVD